MRFFKRGPSETDAGDFWAWWSGARDQVAGAIATGSFDKRLVGEISKRSRSIRHGLGARTGDRAACVLHLPRGQRRAASDGSSGGWRRHHPPTRPGSTTDRSRPLPSSWASRSAAGASTSRDAGDHTGTPPDGASTCDGGIQKCRSRTSDAARSSVDSLLGEDDVERWVARSTSSRPSAGSRRPSSGPRSSAARPRRPSATRPGSWPNEANRTARSPSCSPMPASSASIPFRRSPRHDRGRVRRRPASDRRRGDGLLNEQEDDFLRRLGDVGDLRRQGHGARHADDALRRRGPGCDAPGHRRVGPGLARLAQRGATPDATQDQFRARHGLVVPARPGHPLTAALGRRIPVLPSAERRAPT